MAASPESKAGDFLRKATLAESSGARAKYATRGLAAAGGDRTLRAMLLRQLYLSHMEAERFEPASEVARAIIELDVMADVACQDLARAYLGLGRYREAVDELRRASRLGPASRRAFHLWTLGSVCYFQGDLAGAALAFQRAVRVAFPDGTAYGPDDYPRAVVSAALASRFVDRASWLFYEHEEPYYPEY